MDTLTRTYALRRGLAALLAILVAASLATTGTSHATSASDSGGVEYRDVPANSLHAEAIAAISRAGITEGCAKDRFCPEDPLPRAQMATLFKRALDLGAASRSRFEDVHGSRHREAIDAIAEAGITKGCTEVRFCPDLPVTRAQMASFLTRILDLTPTGEHDFSDLGSSVHARSMLALADAGITKGCAPQRFCGDDPVTRAQFATLLHRAADGDIQTLAEYGKGLGDGTPGDGAAPTPTEPAPDPSESTEPKPTPPSSDPTARTARGGRSGLHFTPAEVEIWRERAQEGPYRVSGDVSPNSPGDWDRIVSNTQRFAADPRDGRWSGPSQGGLGTCVQKWDDAPPSTGPARLRDAAFHALVTGDTNDVEAIHRELLWQAREPGTDFSNQDRWCTGVLIDVNPSFDIANWLTQLLFAYDYLGPDAFTAEERKILDRWFADAATFFQVDVDHSLHYYLVPSGQDEGIVDASKLGSSCGEVNYLSGPANCSIHRLYNNRRAEIARFVALVGVAQRDQSFLDTGRRFVEDLVKYGVFPDGAVGDFHRWKKSNPDLGWAYATQTVGAAVTIADAFARAGDPSLFTYTTSDGVQGTEGGPKSLAFAVRAMGNYVDGTYKRYGTDAPSRAGDREYRIDGVNGAWSSVHDVILTPANRFYRDNHVRGVYTRQGAGTRPYPSSPASGGSHPIWAGEGGTLPGVLFMFGQMEDHELPY